MIRRLVAGLIVVGLAVGIWALWPREDSTTITTTAPDAVASTTSSVAMSTTTIEVTTSSGTTSHVVTTVEEAEEILRELLYMRLHGIFNKDATQLAQVVASQAALDAAVGAFDQIPFEAEPYPEGVILSDSELLRSDDDCLAIWTNVDVTAFQGEGATSSAVVVLRSVHGDWRWASTWRYRDDLWEADCDAQREPLSE